MTRMISRGKQLKSNLQINRPYRKTEGSATNIKSTQKKRLYHRKRLIIVKMMTEKQQQRRSRVQLVKLVHDWQRDVSVKVLVSKIYMPKVFIVIVWTLLSWQNKSTICTWWESRWLAYQIERKPIAIKNEYDSVRCTCSRASVYAWMPSSILRM